MTSRADNADTLIIDTADLPSLVAVSLQRDAEQFVLWHPQFEQPTAAIRLEIAQQHASVFRAAHFVTTQVRTTPLPGSVAPIWWRESELLLSGLGIAEQLGCSRIVWPHRVGGDFTRIGPVVDRATLLSGLRPADDGLDAAVIDLPLLDLSEVQIVELADDSGADLSLHWPCESAGDSPCGDCDGCLPWRTAFEHAGPAWPWEAAHTTAGSAR